MAAPTRLRLEIAASLVDAEAPAAVPRRSWWVGGASWTPCLLCPAGTVPIPSLARAPARRYQLPADVATVGELVDKASRRQLCSPPAARHQPH
jgi:hypothetical protein